MKIIKRIVEFFKSNNQICTSHDFKVIERSNVIQQDDMGNPLRIFIVKCTKCGKTDHHWIDVSEEELKELDTGESVLLTWKKI